MRRSNLSCSPHAVTQWGAHHNPLNPLTSRGTFIRPQFLGQTRRKREPRDRRGRSTESFCVAFDTCSNTLGKGIPKAKPKGPWHLHPSTTSCLQVGWLRLSSRKPKAKKAFAGRVWTTNTKIHRFGDSPIIGNINKSNRFLLSKTRTTVNDHGHLLPPSPPPELNLRGAPPVQALS